MTVVEESRNRPYHHGDLRRALIDAAVAEVEAVGASALSLRAIARRAGVSHAAPAHHFRDKTGIFTAIATEGFRMMTEAIAPVAFGENGFIAGGAAYVQFALEHPGHFEVMFRSSLYDENDPELAEASTAAFDLLFESARAGLEPPGSDEDAEAVAITGWSIAHGAATLIQQTDLTERISGDVAAEIARGVVLLAGITERAQASPDS